MKISIISASHRTNSQSKRISDLLVSSLLFIKSELDIFSLDLADVSLPIWSPTTKRGGGYWGQTVNSIADSFNKLARFS